MTASMAWIALAVAGLLDVAWAIAMKQSQGYTRLGWTLASLVLLIAFVVLLGKALQVLPVGVAYAVWTGIGAVGTMLVGWLLLNEPLERGPPRCCHRMEPSGRNHLGLDAA